jgi:purine-binding chemotaxis protein CheW
VSSSRDSGASAAANVLIARARALARETAADTGSEMIEVLEFGLGQETHAFELGRIREVLELAELTPLPRVPPHVLGITHVRGQIVAVVDLRRIFGMPERGLLNSWQIIVLESPAMEFAVVAERISGVRRIPLADLRPPLPAPADGRSTFVTGIASDGTVVLSADRLLGDPGLPVRQDE